MGKPAELADHVEVPPRPFEGRIEAVEEEEAAIALMVSRRAQGASLRTIAAELTAAGHKTKRGGAWRACTVDVVLRRVGAAA